LTGMVAPITCLRTLSYLGAPTVYNRPEAAPTVLNSSPAVLREPLVRTLLVMLVAIAGLFLAQMVWALVLQFGDLILLFVFAWVIAFLLEPVVASLSRLRWMPRSAAILLVYA